MAITKVTGGLLGNLAVGTNNVALGDGALSDGSLSGNNNTAVGHNALVANTTGASNVAVGTSALSANVGGYFQTAIGFEALKNTNYTPNLFAYSTAVGYQAGVANTTGKITAVGAKVLASNTTGINNAGFGGETDTFGAALQDNTTGSYNSAFGYNALHSNTTAGYQTAIGYNSLATVNGGLENTALGANTLSLTSTGSYNTAIGTTAMYGNTTGSYNVAVGRNALDANTTGQYNTAVGHSALGTIATVSSSTAVGYNALSLATAGQNTALGYEAGGAVTSGGDNVLLGFRAANYQNNLTTGIDNTVVGAYTRLSSGTVSSETVIGRYALGQGTGTVTLGLSGNGVHIALNNSTTNWSKHSDERLKENIVDSTAGLSFINDLRPVTYTWKSKKDISSEFENYYDADSNEPVQGMEDTTYHGFLAQEVKEVIENHSEIKNGHAIWRESPDGIQNLADGALMPMLVKAVQELSAQVEELKSRLGD